MTDVTLSKGRLAAWLKISPTTLSQWLMRFPDFPCIERGSNGREYRFDPVAVSEFLRARQAAQDKTEAAHDEALAQLKLPFDLPDEEAPLSSASPVAELAAWRLRKLQREEAEAAGKLIPAATVADFLRGAFRGISRNDFAVVRQLGREHDWPPAFVAMIEARLTEQYRAVIGTLRQDLGAHAVPPDLDAHAEG